MYEHCSDRVMSKRMLMVCNKLANCWRLRCRHTQPTRSHSHPHTLSSGLPRSLATISPLHFWSWKVKGQSSRSIMQKLENAKIVFGRIFTANRLIYFKWRKDVAIPWLVYLHCLAVQLSFFGYVHLRSQKKRKLNVKRKKLSKTKTKM